MATLEDSLSLYIDQTDNGKTVTLKDTTDWDLWFGGIADITNVKIYAKSEDLGIVDYVLILDNNFTTPDIGDLYWELTSGDLSELGLSSDTVIPDGIITFKYVVTGPAYTDGGAVENYNEYETFFDYNIKLNVYREFSELPNTFCNDRYIYNDEVEGALLRHSLLKSTQYAAALGQRTRLERVFSVLKNMYE